MYKESGVGGKGGLLIGVFWAQIALSIGLIGLRIYTRSFIRGSVGWDDVCLIATLVLNTGFTVFTTVAAVHGMGQHYEDLTVPQFAHAMLYILIGQVFVALATGMGKVAVAMFLLRIVMKPWHRWFLWFCTVSMVLMSIFLAVTVFAQCTPAESIWNPELADQRVCRLSLTVVAITYCSYAAAMDFILAGFPWIALHGLNMKRKERHTICLSLSMGVFAGICGVFRTTGLTSLSNSKDYLYAISDSAIWTCSEVTATIVCLTLPALRPLYKKIRNQESSSGGYQQHNGDSVYANNPSFPLGSLRGSTTDNDKGSNLTEIEASMAGKNDSDEAILLQGPTKRNIVRTQEVSITYKPTGLEGSDSSTRAVEQAAPIAGPAENDVMSSVRNGWPPLYNCVKGQRTCIYAPPKIPLRERRAQQKEVQPWEQTPWEVTVEQRPKEIVCTKKTTVPLRLSCLNHDTGFNKLAVAMPLRSHELFQYYNPCALRSAILMAGMHFSFQFGDLSAFESTFLFHKIEVMRTINRWIATRDYKLEAAIIREMATLAFTEACHGELVAAETHISGILALIETARVDKSDPNRSYVYLTGLKSLLSGICRTGGHGSSLDAVPGRKLLKLSHSWHMSEARENLGLKLLAIRLFPFFFSPLPQGAQLNNADGQIIINSTRDFTASLESISKEIGAETEDGKFDSFWRQGPASRILGEFVMAHIQSISVPEKKEESPEPTESTFIGPWCGMTIATLFYMQDVLGVLEPIDRRIHKYAVTMLQHDVAKVLTLVGTPKNDAFILWQVLVGILGSYRALKAFGEDRALASARQFFEESLKQQAQHLGISSWLEAKQVLRRVVWPSGNINREFIRGVWDKAVSGSPAS
ncbi:sterol regulatory element-binding ECM22 [Fusarium beomiforme]|uniref:Sterol regulatory element-binding ECM22 n=1 Tax=Fusarium beomiforme TaxID=44412 RepID=A0A9P5E664_9HYPO|nr:sterol regulatory element-binding ECM22 [Fusarium beomiforme]